MSNSGCADPEVGYKSLSSENCLFANWNSGPGASPRTTMNARRALTGHSCEPVAPRYTMTPCLYGSVLDVLMVMAIVEGSSRESTAISE